MKHIVATALLFCLVAANINAQVKWQTIEKASQNKGDKIYMIDFYTSWCGWCKKMDKETFNDPTVRKLLNTYFIPVKFNAEGNAEFSWDGIKYTGIPTPPGSRPATHSFAKASLGEQMGFPSFGIFDKNQKLLTIVQGYNTAEEFTIILWYFASGDYNKYAFSKYKEIFNKDIRPIMEQELSEKHASIIENQ